MTTLLRLSLLLLMGGSLLAARWTDGLGQRPAGLTARRLPMRPRPVAQARPSWVLGGGWQGWGRLAGQVRPPHQAPAVGTL